MRLRRFGSFFSPLWRGIFYGAWALGAPCSARAFFRWSNARLRSRVGRVGDARKGWRQGFHVGGASLEPWLLQPLWFLWWRDWSSADLFSCESSPPLLFWLIMGTGCHLCTFFDLDRYDHGDEGLNWLLLVPVWLRGNRRALAQVWLNIERSGVRSGLCGVCCCLS